MKFLSSEEKTNVLHILKSNPEMLLYFEKKLADSESEYLENFMEDFDNDFFEEFYSAKLFKVLSENKVRVKGLNGKEITDKIIVETFEESGSMGLTLLVDEMLSKMVKGGDVTQEILATLLDLVIARNQIQEMEVAVLKAGYTKYLEAQIRNLES